MDEYEYLCLDENEYLGLDTNENLGLEEYEYPGLDEWDGEESVLNQVLAESQQEYLNSLKSKSRGEKEKVVV